MTKEFIKERKALDIFDYYKEDGVLLTALYLTANVLLQLSEGTITVELADKRIEEIFLSLPDNKKNVLEREHEGLGGYTPLSALRARIEEEKVLDEKDRARRKKSDKTRPISRTAKLRMKIARKTRGYLLTPKSSVQASPHNSQVRTDL